MALPRAVNGNNYRTEEVDISPGGSTIAVTVPSDNPFELCGDVTVHTQMSGGMTAPDPRQRSRRISTGKGVIHVNRGFMPGMGDGEEVVHGAYGAVKRHPVLRRPAKRVTEYTVRPTGSTRRQGGFMPGMGDDPAPAQSGTFGTFLKDVASAAMGIVGASGTAEAAKREADAKKRLAEAQIVGNQAAIIQAQAALAQAQRPDAPQRGMSTGTKVGIGLGSLAAIGLVIYLLARKK